MDCLTCDNVLHVVWTFGAERANWFVIVATCRNASQVRQTLQHCVTLWNGLRAIRTYHTGTRQKDGSSQVLPVSSNYWSAGTSR